MDEPDTADTAAQQRIDELGSYGGWPGVITQLIEGRDLTAHEAATAMGAILAGGATPAQLIAFSVALRIKGETADELSGLLDAVLAAATPVPLPDALRSRAIDIVGTGGDRSHSINVAIELAPEGVQRCVQDAGIGFCFAPRFHPAFRFAAPARREVGVPLMFNLLGPMANPGRVRRQLIGVADPRFAERMLATLRAHGSTDAWVVHGGDLDELTTTGTSTVLALDHDGTVRTFTIDPVELGFAPATHDQLVGGDPTHNAAVVRSVLGGERGAHRDIVVLNAAAGLVVASAAATLDEGVERAASSIDTGRAAAALDSLVATSQAAAAEEPAAP